MVVLPADHVIAKPAEFLRVLRAGGQMAAQPGRRSVVIGLKPTRPDTGFGYVRIGGREATSVAGQRDLSGRAIHGKAAAACCQTIRGLRTLSLERRHVHLAGRYLAGKFRQIPTAHGASNWSRLPRLAVWSRKRSFRRLFPRFEKISIDYAIMERIRDIHAVAADIGWNDVGSWAVVYGLSKKDREANVRPDLSLCLDSRGNMIVSKRKFVVTVGVQDLVIVETDDALLVCARDHSQEVGKAVQALEGAGLKSLL